jgi:hypothetical protein
MAMKAGRNDPCPSGQPIKFKKCLANHPQLRADASPAEVWWVCSRWIAPRPPAWELFESLPTTAPVPVEKVNALLDELLHHKPEETEWDDVLTTLRNRQYPDLAGVFRRIDRELPDDTEDKALFYWAAAEVLDEPDLLREVTAGFVRLDAHSYNADALLNVENRLLAAGLEDETLQLCERFLPIVEVDCGLLPHAVPELIHRILHLRLGRLVRHHSGGTIDLERVMRDMVAGLPEGVALGPLRKGVEILLGLAPEPKVTRKNLAFVLATRKKIPQNETFCVWNTLLRAVREAFLIDGAAPGQALCAMDLLLDAAESDLEDAKDEDLKPVPNLADLPGHEDLEGFVSQASQQIVGIDRSRAELLLLALRILTRFLVRHEVIGAATAQSAEVEIDRLAALLNRRAEGSESIGDDLSPGDDD